MYIAYIGFKDDFTSAITDRYDHKKVKFFKELPTVEQIIKSYDLGLPEDNPKDHSIFMRALSDMINGHLGYFYGVVFLLKKINFEEGSVEHAC